LGHLHIGQDAISREAKKHFKSFYNQFETPPITEQVKVACLFNSWLSEEEAKELFLPVTSWELKSILFHFKKEKSPGPDGWTVEFFTHFFDLIIEELLALVESIRSRGHMAGNLNSTFLALIPKSNNLHTFGDYHPISLCNLIYKLISKVLANQIKPILSKNLSVEKFGFLEGRLIHDAIGTTHECIHSIKQKNLKALLLKLDLQKDFDCVN
jgi:hypothetical protein